MVWMGSGYTSSSTRSTLRRYTTVIGIPTGPSHCAAAGSWVPGLQLLCVSAIQARPIRSKEMYRLSPVRRLRSVPHIGLALPNTSRHMQRAHRMFVGPQVAANTLPNAAHVCGAQKAATSILSARAGLHSRCTHPSHARLPRTRPVSSSIPPAARTPRGAPPCKPRVARTQYAHEATGAVYDGPRLAPPIPRSSGTSPLPVCTPPAPWTCARHAPCMAAPEPGSEKP